MFIGVFWIYAITILLRLEICLTIHLIGDRYAITIQLVIDSYIFYACSDDWPTCRRTQRRHNFVWIGIPSVHLLSLKSLTWAPHFISFVHHPLPPPIFPLPVLVGATTTSALAP